MYSSMFLEREKAHLHNIDRVVMIILFLLLRYHLCVWLTNKHPCVCIWMGRIWHALHWVLSVAQESPVGLGSGERSACNTMVNHFLRNPRRKLQRPWSQLGSHPSPSVKNPEHLDAEVSLQFTQRMQEAPPSNHQRIHRVQDWKPTPLVPHQDP